MSERRDEKESDLEKKLSYKADFAWPKYTEEQKRAARVLAQDYLIFLKETRTERERVAFAERLAQGKGFRQVELGESAAPLKAGEKVYYVNRGKNIALFVVGDAPMTSGHRFIGAHGDFPRLDLKIDPLYEKDGFALFKTHYYGGIKKYQYATVPLVLAGVVAKKDGDLVKIDVGSEPDDPVFVIPDLLVHLAHKVQGERKAFDTIKAEEMNAVVGALQIGDEKAKNRFKLNVLSILNEKYGITEDDFHSAELSLVPAITPRYIGLDKSMVGAAGQDDGASTFLALRAILDLAPGAATGTTGTTGTGIFDKEETGSNGPTGAQSSWMQSVVADMVSRTGVEASLTNVHLAFRAMKMISADVTAALDPSFGSVHDPQTAAMAGKGVVVEKYSGSGGKRGTNDATAEYVGFIRRVFSEANVPFQFGTLGQVDAGGGGTIAMFFAQNFNCDVVDCGVPVLNMHSPYEVTHIADLYSGYLAYKAFLSA
ncbi:MAG: aminopeptidase [Candidatus Lokiarchaeota archaeon]|nr:aminopeptidase [Candidatus Lokiarchaeota archaeon]